MGRNFLPKIGIEGVNKLLATHRYAVRGVQTSKPRIERGGKWLIATFQRCNNVEVPGGRLGLEMVCVEPPRVRGQIGCFLIQDDLIEKRTVLSYRRELGQTSMSLETQSSIQINGSWMGSIKTVCNSGGGLRRAERSCDMYGIVHQLILACDVEL